MIALEQARKHLETLGPDGGVAVRPVPKATQPPHQSAQVKPRMSSAAS